MNLKNRSKIWYKMNGTVRLALARNCGIVPKQYLINEYPKSGGTWFAQMLARYTGVPYIRFELPRMGSNILHSHYLSEAGISSPIIVWRDPRDVLISHFYHCIFEKKETSSSNTNFVRKLVGIGEGETPEFHKHFPKFYDLSMSGVIHPHYSWTQFFDNWFEREDAFHTSYERLHGHGVAEIVRASETYNLQPQLSLSAESVYEEFEFSKQAGREKGTTIEQAFLRKGVAGDWRNTLNKSELEQFYSDFGSRIERYESSKFVQPEN